MITPEQLKQFRSPKRQTCVWCFSALLVSALEYQEQIAALQARVTALEAQAAKPLRYEGVLPQ